MTAPAESDPLQTSEIIALEERYQVPVYAKLPLSIERGEGCYVFDADGNRFLDMYGGHCVTATGHCHPAVVSAIQAQAEKLIFYSNATFNGVRAQAGEALIESCGAHFHQALFVNSGAEANENAIKLARAITGRTEVLSCKNSFHGRTYGSLSATGTAHRNYLNTPVPGHRVLEHHEIAAAVTEQTAAVLLEPIQSMGGVFQIPKETIAAITVQCRKVGALLLFDEIQTGVGRTGTFLYAHQFSDKPDMVSLAKGIASGYPVGALVVTEQVAKHLKNGDLGTTFGGSPLGSAATLATLQVIREEGLIENAARIGSFLTKRLGSMAQVTEVRGQGLLLGIRFANKTAKEVQQVLLRNGILAGSSSDPGILRLMPPLTLTEVQAETFIEVIATL